MADQHPKEDPDLMPIGVGSIESASTVQAEAASWFSQSFTVSCSAVRHFSDDPAD